MIHRMKAVGGKRPFPLVGKIAPGGGQEGELTCSTRASAREAIWAFWEAVRGGVRREVERAQ